MFFYSKWSLQGQEFENLKILEIIAKIIKF